MALLVATPFYPRGATGQPYGQAPPSPVDSACYFFFNLRNVYLDLLAETPGSNFFYVASDNLLAQGALTRCTPGVGLRDTGELIRASITNNLCCNKGNDSLHEVLLGHPIQLPIYSANRFNVTSSWPEASMGYPFHGPITVYYENHTGTGILSDAQYGDIAAYTVLELEREGNHQGALREINLLNWMYDGKGIADDVYRYGTGGERGTYQTFKTALYLLALVKTGQHIPAGLEEALFSKQGSDGGFHTGYDSNGNYAGTLENVETTSIVMLALTSLPPRIYIDPLSYHNITGTGSVRLV